MRNTKLIAFALLAAVLTLGLSACGGGDKEMKEEKAPPAAKEQPAPAPQMKEVVLYQYRFNPNTLTVPSGTNIKFTNKDPDRHNVNIPALNIDQTLAAGESFQHTFSTTGEFAVSNRFASKPMKMTIVVQ